MIQIPDTLLVSTVLSAVPVNLTRWRVQKPKSEEQEKSKKEREKERGGEQEGHYTAARSQRTQISYGF